MNNPYLINGPALVSFSGGRTSAFMLHEIVEAHGGTLPDDVVVAFANTGKERDETLRFVHECGARWGVRVRWLEFRKRSGTLADRFEEVGFNSAARQGEPFAALIASKKFTPNSLMRFCTEELKVSTIQNFATESLGWTRWTNIIGLRYDEGHRVLKQIAKNDSERRVWTTVMPLSKAKVRRADVMAFWRRQPFDLGLEPHEGNCDLCFLKSRGAIKRMIRDNPGVADWWKRQELVGKGCFVTEYSYADLEREVREQPFMPGLLDDDEHDTECGLHCGGDMLEAAQ